MSVPIDGEEDYTDLHVDFSRRNHAFSMENVSYISKQQNGTPSPVSDSSTGNKYVVGNSPGNSTTKMSRFIGHNTIRPQIPELILSLTRIAMDSKDHQSVCTILEDKLYLNFQQVGRYMKFFRQKYFGDEWCYKYTFLETAAGRIFHLKWGRIFHLKWGRMVKFPFYHSKCITGLKEVQYCCPVVTSQSLKSLSFQRTVVQTSTPNEFE